MESAVKTFQEIMNLSLFQNIKLIDEKVSYVGFSTYHIFIQSKLESNMDIFS